MTHSVRLNISVQLIYWVVIGETIRKGKKTIVVIISNRAIIERKTDC